MEIALLHQDIDRPFGEDQDANRGARSIMSAVGQLSVESRKLAQTNFQNVNAMHRQRLLVQDLRDQVVSAASRAHVPADDMLEAARRLLEKQTRRRIVIHPAPIERPHMDADQRRLDAAVLDAQDQLLRAEDTLKRVTTRVQNLKLLLSQRQADATRHRAVQLGRAA
jgi:hypothetical protein